MKKSMFFLATLAALTTSSTFAGEALNTYLNQYKDEYEKASNEERYKRVPNYSHDKYVEEMGRLEDIIGDIERYKAYSLKTVQSDELVQLFEKKVDIEGFDQNTKDLIISNLKDYINKCKSELPGDVAYIASDVVYVGLRIISVDGVNFEIIKAGEGVYLDKRNEPNKIIKTIDDLDGIVDILMKDDYSKHLFIAASNESDHLFIDQEVQLYMEPNSNLTKDRNNLKYSLMDMLTAKENIIFIQDYTHFYSPSYKQPNWLISSLSNASLPKYYIIKSDLNKEQEIPVIESEEEVVEEIVDKEVSEGTIEDIQVIESEEAIIGKGELEEIIDEVIEQIIEEDPEAPVEITEDIPVIEEKIPAKEPRMSTSLIELVAEAVAAAAVGTLILFSINSKLKVFEVLNGERNLLYKEGYKLKGSELIINMTRSYSLKKPHSSFEIEVPEKLVNRMTADTDNKKHVIAKINKDDERKVELTEDILDKDKKMYIIKIKNNNK